MPKIKTKRGSIKDPQLLLGQESAKMVIGALYSYVKQCQEAAKVLDKGLVGHKRKLVRKAEKVERKRIEVDLEKIEKEVEED